MKDTKNSKVRIRDGEATKKKIIKTAEKLFSRKGFNGVSIRDLAKACNMSGPLILHHFGSKEGIYDAVRLDLIENYIPAFEDIENEGKDLFDFIEYIVRGTFEFHRENPIALRLMNWDRLDGNKKRWPKSEEFKRIFVERIQKAIDNGEVKGNFSAKNYGLMIGGMIHLWWEERQDILQRRLGDKYTKEEALKADEEYIQQILWFIKNSLKK